MRKFSILLLILGCLVTASVNAATSIQPIDPLYPPAKSDKQIAELKIRDVQKLIGRKLTLKEKISFLILRHRIKHSDNKGTGEAALGFGIAAVVMLIIGFFVPYVILISLVSAILAVVLGSVARKRDPTDEKAMVGRLLGWITLGLMALLLIIAAIALSGSSWW